MTAIVTLRAGAHLRIGAAPSFSPEIFLFAVTRASCPE
jgi:hypothetical protein